MNISKRLFQKLFMDHYMQFNFEVNVAMEQQVHGYSHMVEGLVAEGGIWECCGIT